MMRKFILIVVFIAGALISNAQNVQLHYDFSGDRNYLTTTVEKFNPDKYGSTFFFVDFDYSADGPKLAYWEIARELKNWDAPFSIHVEYNGGFSAWETGDDEKPWDGFHINNAYLLGGTYSWNASDFSKGFSLSAMYKNIQGNESPNNFQLTGVWYVHMLDGKLSFTGFADFWRETKSWQGTEFIFLSEPQLWYNFNKTFSLGAEIELSNNFVKKGFATYPTVGVKWTIN